MNSKIKKLIIKINEYNDQDKVLLLGLSYCPYTLKSKKYLDSKNLKYKYYNIDKYHNIFIDLLHQLADQEKSFNINASHKTFPVIFYNKKFIGGFDDLIKYFN